MTKALNAKEAASYLGVHVETLRRLARRGDVPSFKVGRDWRFNKTDLDEWIRNYTPDNKKPHVIIVDDEENILHFLDKILVAHGFRVSAFTSGHEALELFHRNPPDLAMIDLKMPLMSGPELMKEIRNINHHIPLVVFTGYPDSDLMLEALQSSPFTMITKPSTVEKIVETVDQALNGTYKKTASI